MIIGLVNQKGGAGKTTVSVHLAYWLSHRGSVCLVDADIQKSSSSWMKYLKLPWRVVNDPSDLFDILPALAEEYEAVVVDAPGNLREVVSVLLDRCDVALVPCKQSGLDLHSTTETIRLIRQRQEIRGGKPKAALFINQAKKGTLLLRDSQEILIETGFPTLDTYISDRQCIMDTPGQCTTVWQMSGKAAKSAKQEFEALFSEAMEVIGGK